MDKAVRAVAPGEAGLEVVWDTGERTSYPWLWLRDHATDPQSYDSRSGQRELYTAGLDPGIRGLAARLSPDGHSVEIDWPDGPRGVAYDAGFLWRFRAPAPAAASPDRRQPVPSETSHRDLQEARGKRSHRPLEADRYVLT